MSTGYVNRAPSYWAWAGAAFSLALVCYRVTMLGPPEVFADEYSYGIWAKHFFDGSTPPALAVDINNWLFLRIMSLAFVPHGDITFYARLINALAASLSALPVYFVLRRRTSAPIAVVSGVLYATCCAGNTAAYFMPDAMFFSAFAFMCLALMRFIEKPVLTRLVLLATCLAATSLIKIHAIFLLPPLLLTILAAKGLKHRSWMAGLAYCVAFVAAAWIANIALSFALTYRLALNVLGGFYSGLASSSAPGIGWNEFVLAAQVVGEHLLVILPILLAPLAFIGASVWEAFRDRAEPDTAGHDWPLFCAFTVIALATLLCVTALFTVQVAMHQAQGSLHGRYYEDVAIMVMLAGWACSRPLPVRLSLPLGVAAGLLIVAGARFIAHHGWHSPVDFSIVYAAFSGRQGLTCFVIFALCSLLAMIPRVPIARPLMVLTGAAYLLFNAYATDELRQAITRTDEDLIPSSTAGGKGRVIIFTEAVDANTYRAAYTLMGSGASVDVATSSECASMPPDTGMIVTLQGIGPKCGFEQRYTTPRVWAGVRSDPSP
jgi:hypothetical protein